MKVGIAYNTVENSHHAGEEAAKEAVISSGKPALTFLFTTDSYDQEAVFTSVKEVVGDSRIVGFCCGGVITSDGVLTQGVGVCTLSGSELRVATSLQKGLSNAPQTVGERAAKDLLASGIDNGVIFVLPDGFGANISEVVYRLYDSMGPDFKYIGGCAGDNLRFFKTYQFTEAGVESDAVAVALLDGLAIQTAIGHGWNPIGAPLIIGNVDGKKVIEIDGERAFDAYSRRLGGIPLDKFHEYGMKYPLGFPNISGSYLIRDPLTVNPDKSINFVTEIPPNVVGYIMEGKVSNLIKAAGWVAKTSAQKVSQPQFALCFDCISRYLLMGKKFEKELEIITESIGKDIPILGALTFGEVGSYAGTPLFHNKTFTIVVGGSKK
ncbi:MAG: FIST N-terminal domain-containing protein [bacterium]